MMNTIILSISRSNIHFQNYYNQSDEQSNNPPINRPNSISLILSKRNVFRVVLLNHI